MQLNHRTQARLDRLIDIAYYALILAAFYLFMKYVFWLVFPFLFSFFVAVTLQKPMNYAHRKIRLKKSFTAIALVLLFYVVILIIIALIGVRVWDGAKAFMDYLGQQLKNLPELFKGLEQQINQLIAPLPDSIENFISTWMANLNSNLFGDPAALAEAAAETGEAAAAGSDMLGSLLSSILEWFKAPMNGMLAVAGQIPVLAFTLVITVISSFFMTTSYDSIVNFIKRQLKPDAHKALSAAKRILFSSLGKLARSYLTIMFVTFCELCLGLTLLRLCKAYDGRWLIPVAAATALVDILPVLGTGSVILPWAIYSLIMKRIGMGVGLLVMWVVIIVVRQVLEPKLVASNLGLPPVVTLAGMYIGLQLFGFVGLFIMPILLILLKLLNDEGVVHIWKRAEGGKKQEARGKRQEAKNRRQERESPPPA